MPEPVVVEGFSADERRALEPYFTNLDGPVFALRNLPEVVKAALFARYSRSPKSLRRLFLDEFLDTAGGGLGEASVGVRRSEQLFQRVLADYGDDSVAQLGGAHLAVEGASNLLTKALEWGRLMAYLEQSTRYIPYTQRDGGAWRYVVPAELDGSPLRARYVALLDRCFETYAGALPAAIALCEQRLPRPEGVGAVAHTATIRAMALDALRGLLPAATRSNVGIFGTGQAYESLLLHLRAHPLAEARACAEAMKGELDQVIPAFLTRVDRPERGGVWVDYLRETRVATAAIAAELLRDVPAEPADTVTLTDYDPNGEVKVVAAALYAVTALPDAFRQVFMLREVEGLSTLETAECLGINEETVKTRLHRARRQMRRYLSERIGTASPAAFQFHARRCDRVVAGVMEAIRADQGQPSHS